MSIWLIRLWRDMPLRTLFFLNVLAAGFFLLAPFLAPNDPLEVHADLALAAPSTLYPLGNDALGRCFLSRLLAGGSGSLFFTFFIVLAVAFLGMGLGMTAALVGGRIEFLFMRFLDVALSVPTMALTLVMVAVFGNGLTTTALAIISVSWLVYARTSHAVVLGFRESGFVQQARMGGVGRGRILSHYVLPNVLPHIIILMTQDFGDKLLMLSTLSLLGLGAQPPTPEWGFMLSEGKAYLERAPLLLIAPGFLIFFHVVLFNLLGDRLQDVLDPKRGI